MTPMLRFALLATAIVTVSACATTPQPTVSGTEVGLNRLAERYVKTVLALGEHDANYVDAYYGPQPWREAVQAAPSSLAGIKADADQQILQLDGMLLDRAPVLERLRHHYLRRQLQAVVAHAQQLQGRSLRFNDEAQVLYGVTPPQLSDDELRVRHKALEQLLPPGAGTLAQRYNAYMDRYQIPADKLEAVMQAAIEEARQRTRARMDLPEDERFELALVSGKSWSAYNWYQGGYHSRIEINTDLPVTVTRAIELAVHEGYPGHHVYNVQLERTLVRGRGWQEYSVYPLYTPQSLIAEGSADYAIALAFPLESRVAFVSETLFPLAGFDPEEAERYVAISEAADVIGAATIEAARRYLDGMVTADATVKWMQEYALASEARARQRVKFFDDYRAYIVNYSLGEQLIGRYIESKAGDDIEQRWAAFSELISSPRLPASLQVP